MRLAKPRPAFSRDRGVSLLAQKPTFLPISSKRSACVYVLLLSDHLVAGSMSHYSNSETPVFVRSRVDSSSSGGKYSILSTISTEHIRVTMLISGKSRDPSFADTRFTSWRSDYGVRFRRLKDAARCRL